MAESTDLELFTSLSGRAIEDDLAAFETEEQCLQLISKVERLSDFVLSVGYWIEGKVIHHMRGQVQVEHPVTRIAASLNISVRLLGYCESLAEAFTLDQVKLFHNNGYTWSTLRGAGSRSIDDENREELVDKLTRGELTNSEVLELVSSMVKKGPGKSNELPSEGGPASDDDEDDGGLDGDPIEPDPATADFHDIPPDFHELLTRIDDVDSICLSMADSMERMDVELRDELSKALNYIPSNSRAVNQSKQLETHILNLNEDMTLALARLIRAMDTVRSLSKQDLDIKDIIRSVLYQIERNQKTEAAKVPTL